MPVLGAVPLSAEELVVPSKSVRPLAAPSLVPSEHELGLHRGWQGTTALNDLGPGGCLRLALVLYLDGRTPSWTMLLRLQVDGRHQSACVGAARSAWWIPCIAGFVSSRMSEQVPGTRAPFESAELQFAGRVPSGIRLVKFRALALPSFPSSQCDLRSSPRRWC